MHLVEIGRLHRWQMLRSRRLNYSTDHVVVAHCSTSMDSEPLLDLLATHRTLRWPDRYVRVLDRHDNVRTPLTHNHVAARQYSNISYLLVANLASQYFCHF
jgi:hypothetical protein